MLIAVHVLDEFLNSDSFIGVLQMWTVGVTRIARHSKFGVDSSSFKTLCFYVQRFKLFWVCLRSVCFSSVFGYRVYSLSNDARESALGVSME